jgi:poly(hydroxyalkanoate) depolymerase family esterase
MARLNRTIGDLRQMQERWASTLGGGPQAWQKPGRPGPSLDETTQFGVNPGGLRMFSHVPDGLERGAALVVALHGCTQDASSYARGSGWITLADRHGFAVLLPEQTPRGNAKGCFSWFDPRLTRRDLGEVASIRAMMDTMIARHGLDPARVHVTGLSAGAAMGASLLAAYPERFASAGLVAGLPHGAAVSVQQAFEAMAQGGRKTPQQWGNLVRAASAHQGAWPRVSIWHGDADRTVVTGNADALVAQWTDVHGLDVRAGLDRSGDGVRRQVWLGTDGAVAVERVLVPGLGHGLPIDAGIDGGGEEGAFFLEAGVASSAALCDFFGISDSASRPEFRPAAGPADRGPGRDAVRGASGRPGGTSAAAGVGGIDVGEVISRALRSAGLLKD